MADGRLEDEYSKDSCSVVGLEIVSNLIHNSFGPLTSSYFSFVSYMQHLGIKYVNSQESPIVA